LYILDISKHQSGNTLASCAALETGGDESPSGIYKIKPQSSSKAMQANGLSHAVNHPRRFRGHNITDSKKNIICYSRPS